MAEIATTLEVNVEGVRQSAKYRGETAEAIKGLTDNMLKLVEGSKSVYQGEAATAYTSKFAELGTSFKAVYDMVSEQSSDLAEVANIMEDTESQNKSAAQSLSADGIR